MCGRLLSSRPQRGFTLVEMVMVIVVLGVVSAMVAVFMKSPIDAYFATSRRAALTDAADLAARRIARDLRTALPNSIGPSAGNSLCVEFIPTKAGGRYIADDSANALRFNTPVSSFYMLGPSSTASVNDWIAVYNLGITGADAYNQDNVVKLTGSSSGPASPPQTRLTFATKTFTLSSPSNRFLVIPAAEQSVAYVCDPGTTRTLRRLSAASFTHLCAGGAATTDTVLANNVSGCNFQYTGADLQRNGLVSFVLQLTLDNETVSLQQEVHVNNTP